MSRAYSDHFDPTGVATLTGTTDFVEGQKVASGKKHSRLRVSIARATVGTAGMTQGDELRMMRMRSSDRLIRLNVNSDGGSTNYAADIGLYLTGADGDGAVVDVDLFAAADAIASGNAMEDMLGSANGANTVTDEDRGKTLWEMAALGAASYTTDPKIDFDIVLTATTTGITVVNEVTLIAEYLSGD